MKKIISIIVAILTIFAFGCSVSPENNNSSGKESTDAQDISSEYQIVKLHADWPIYGTSQGIVEASTNIYSGKVTNISFCIIDMTTGEPDNQPESISTSHMLYTIYTIAVTESYKGQNLSEIKIKKIGGLPSYHAKEQYELMESSGMLSKYNGIPVIDGGKTLDEGEEYLFCTERTTGPYDLIINLSEFAHDIGSKSAMDIIKACK